MSLYTSACTSNRRRKVKQEATGKQTKQGKLQRTRPMPTKTRSRTRKYKKQDEKRVEKTRKDEKRGEKTERTRKDKKRQDSTT